MTILALELPATASAQPTASPHPTASAQPTASQRRALELTQQALEARSAGELERSLELLLAAHELTDQPVLLFNLGKTYQELGRLSEAREYFRRYLDTAPSADDAETVTSRLEALDQQIAQDQERERLREEAAADARAASLRADAAEAKAGESMSWVPWVVTIVGGATLIAAGALGIAALSEESRADEAPNHAIALDRIRAAEGFATAANVTLAVGAVIGVAGGAWLLFSLLSSSDSTDDASTDGASKSVRPWRVTF